jgi:hypothetical protein
VLDAVECPPTFGVAPEVVVGLIAGGEKAFVKAVEGAEDSRELGRQDLVDINLTKTDIVIGDAAVVESAEIEDISLTSSQSINSGSSLNTITYKNTVLSSNYVLEGKLDIIKRTSNAHIQFGILDNGNERILLWDNNSDGNVKLVIPYNTNVPAEDIYKHENGTTLTLNWKIVATDDDVYFYLNGELKLVYAAQKGLSSHPLTLGSEGVECKFYDMKAITKAADPDEFNAALGEMADVINTYGSKTTAEKIRA